MIHFLHFQRLFIFLISFSFLIAYSCEQDKSAVIESTIQSKSLDFEEMDASRTGIEFINKLFESDQLNFYTYEYLYNGGGVSVADFNNDGFQDIFFTCNMGKNKLYANKGNFTFEDVSKTSGINSVRDWCTGSTITDINNDGLIDLYVSRSGWFEDSEIRKNLLYVNLGNFRFEEQAEQYGIADAGHTTQSCFFDMDQDGDLDLYVMNHPTTFSESVPEFQKNQAKPNSNFSDHLYENVDGKFKNISSQAGIVNYGHGLGLSILDFNGDMLPDIYVSNDYQQHDYIYINQGNKTFKEESNSRLKHQAKFSMGVDAVDLSKNGSFDLMAVEMMPSDNFRQKTNMANMNPEMYNTYLDIGLQHQEMHNVLQLNSGDGHFTDVAYQYQIAQTDWSWSPLFGDFDSDGNEDLFISNGYRRDVLNKDLKSKIKAKIKSSTFKYSEVQNLLKEHKSKNYFYKNTAESFDQQNMSISIVNTNGAALADLDNDGNLDIICNNMEDKSTVYRNANQNTSDYTIKLTGPSKNKLAIGTSLKITTNKTSRIFNNQPTKGFQSSSGLDILFSLEDGESIENAMLIWPDLKTQSVSLKSGINKLAYNPSSTFNTTKKVVNKTQAFPYNPSPNFYDDYKDQVLLPYKVSEIGPKAVTYKDANNNLAICIVDQSSEGIYFFEQNNGKWQKSNISVKLGKSPLCSGIAAGDLNQDGLADLYITRGNYSDKNNEKSQDMILLQKKDGDFELKNSPINFSTSCPQIADFNGDGKMDIFYAGGLNAGEYPNTYSSGVLINDEGGYKNIELKNLQGIPKSSEIMDLDNDEIDDIIFTGEWMNIHAYSFKDGKAEKIKDLFDDNLTGWYNSIESADLDGDNIPEIIIGNIGNNTKMSNKAENAFHLYSEDYDDNGNLDIVFAFEDENKLFPVRGKQCSSEQIPSLNNKFKDYENFAKSDVFEIYGAKELQESNLFQVKRYLSGYYKKNGTSFEWRVFPSNMQQSLIRATSVVENKLCPIIYYHGNQAFEVETGRLDGFTGSTYQTCTDEKEIEVKMDGMCTQILELDNQMLYLFKENPAELRKK